MIPILLQGHTRPLTKIRFNRDGDLLFSAAKDATPSVWFAHNGERLGTFNGHAGAVWDLAVSEDSRFLVTGSADNSLRVWRVSDGTQLACLETRTAVKSVSLMSNDDFITIAYVTAPTMGKQASISVVQFCPSDNAIKPLVNHEWPEKGTHPLVVSFGPSTLITGHEDGRICAWLQSADSLSLRKENKNGHSGSIRDLQWSRDGSYFITASKDMTSRVFDAAELQPRCLYRTENPLNSAAVSPLRYEVCIAGGQEAVQVTTTGSRAGNFEARFYDQLAEEEIGRVRGHFGPINTVAYAPDGRGYASGGEDGYVRLHRFDPEYFRLGVSVPPASA